MYTNIYQNRSFRIIEDIPILELFSQLDWIPLASFIGTAYAKIVHLFYSNIIKHDMNETYLKQSIFGMGIEITSNVVIEVLGIPLVNAPFCV